MSTFVIRRRRIQPVRVFIWCALACVAVIMMYPIYFMVKSSLEDPGGASSGVSFASWSRLTAELPVGQQMINSTIVTLAAIAIIILVSLPAGFAFAKLLFPGRALALLLVLSCLLVPMQTIIISEYVNLSGVGLTNSYIGAILVYAALGTPFATFLFTTFFKGLPDELLEAASVDGASYFRTLISIAAPLSVPAAVTVAVLQFIQIWDDLLVGLLFLQDPAQRTITVGLAVLQSGRTISLPVLMAGSLLSAIPAILVYLFFQRRIVQGLTLGVSK